jgi:hypothetical protein
MAQSGWIESTSSPGMASTDSFGRAPCPADWSIFVDGVYGILGAGGDVAAVAAQKPSEGGAIKHNEVDEEPLHRFSCQIEWSLSIKAVRSF